MNSSSLYLQGPLHMIYHKTLTENVIYKAADLLGFLIKCQIHTPICPVHSQQAKNRDIKEEQILSPSTSSNPFHIQTIVLLEERGFCWTEKRDGSLAFSPAKVSCAATNITCTCSLQALSLVNLHIISRNSKQALSNISQEGGLYIFFYENE